MKRQIVFVLSTNYAGSHFLSLQLGSHSRCASIGELHTLRRTGRRRMKACWMCEDDERCPQFKGLFGLPLAELFDRLFNNFSEAFPDVKVGIDNSKKPRWAKHFLTLQGFERKYIHLIRDPRALVRRWLLADKRRKTGVRRRTARRCWRHAWNILTGSEANIYLWKWLYQNREITRLIRRNALDARIITYRDLVARSAETLTELMNWLGLEYEPSQTEYWRFVHHGTVKRNYLRPPESGRPIPDQRWKDFLDDRAQDLAFRHPAVRAYLSDIQVDFDEREGLLGTASPGR